MTADAPRIRRDVIDPWPVRAMRGLLEQDPDAVFPGDPLPLGWHWLYFRDPLLTSSLGPDGHEGRGKFMPAGDLPQRMWAGGSLRALRPVIVGEPAELLSRVAGVVEKRGRNGRLAFATVRHELRQRDSRCVEEEQVIVYRGTRPRAEETRHGHDPELASPHDEPAWTETFLPTEVVLFRFSALTYNAHRIHYDRPYAESEGYPDLLVHAPLTVLALLNAAERRWGVAGDFEYRAKAPLFANQSIRLVGRETHADPHGPCKVVEALGPDGAKKMVGRFIRPIGRKP